MTRRRQIIAIGGAAFGQDAKTPSIERYILSKTRKREPALCFLGTATGDHESYLASFYASFGRYRCRPMHVPLFGRTPDLERVLLSQDVIVVGGGNTKSMLAVWREWGIPSLLRRAWRAGTILTGSSAGAICWFEMGITDSWASDLRPLPGLGFLPNTCCPHFDSEPERRPTVHQLVASGAVPRVLALDDAVAAHFVGRRLVRLVSPRKHAHGYDVRRQGRRAIETALPVVLL